MTQSVFNVTEFTQSVLYNCIKVVRLKPDQPNQWLRAYCMGVNFHESAHVFQIHK